MKRILLMAVLAWAGAACYAEDAKPADPKPADAKPADAKPEEAKPTETKPAAGTPVTKTGKLSAPFGDDKTIVAVLHTEDPNAAPTKGKGKGKKNKNAAAPSDSFNLAATGDAATRIADFMTRNALVEVSGNLADGKITVTEVKESTAQTPEPKKKKKKNQ